jgi:hypothetical protein
MGRYHHHLVFGWNNADYRLTIKESQPWVDRQEARAVAGNFENCKESTCTVFLNPCLTEAKI